MKLIPLENRLIVAPYHEENNKADGALAYRGKVVAASVGPGNVVEGDEVLYPRYVGSTVKVDGVEQLILRWSDILAVVER